VFYVPPTLLLLLFSTFAQAQQPPPAHVVTTTVKTEMLAPTSHIVGVLRFIRVSQVAADVEGLITKRV